MQNVLVVVDMQNDFIDGALGTKEAKAFLPEVPVLVDAACCAGVTPESHKNALNAMKVCQVKVENE